MSHAEPTVPGPIRLAARRGFLRTTLQAYAATIPAGGVSVAALTSLVSDPDPLVIILTAVSVIVSPVLAGAASWASIISRGIPGDYAAAVEAPTEIAPSSVGD